MIGRAIEKGTKKGLNKNNFILEKEKIFKDETYSVRIPCNLHPHQLSRQNRGSLSLGSDVSARHVFYLYVVSRDLADWRTSYNSFSR